ISRMDKTPVYLRKPIFEKLFNIAEYTNLTKEERNMYDSSLKYKWDNKNVLDHAVSEAREEARLEEAREIARTFKSMGLPLEDIAKGTGLSIEEIEKL
ncbi:MAG: PD-(D/E)XK nuclease family transposase, partial [Mucilaginibacter sp.]